MRGIARSPVYRAAPVLFVLPLLFSAVLGIGVTIEPGTLAEGNPFSITLSGVTDGYTLNTTIAATFPPASSTSWFNLTNWRYSFGLQQGNLSVTGRNVNRIMLLVRSGNTYHMAEQTGTGVITVGLPMDILPGVYYDYRVLYEVHTSGAPVGITLVQQGSKTGPDESVSTPVVFGMSEGNLTVEVRANGTFEGSRGIQVSNLPVLPTTPLETATGTQSPTPPAASVTVTGTTIPVTTNLPVQTTLVQTPSVPPTTEPTPGPGGFSIWIIGFAAVLIVITIIADYFIMRD